MIHSPHPETRRGGEQDGTRHFLFIANLSGSGKANFFVMLLGRRGQAILEAVFLHKQLQEQEDCKSLFLTQNERMSIVVGTRPSLLKSESSQMNL